MKEYKITIPMQQKQIYSGHLKLGGTNPAGECIGFTNYYMTLHDKPTFPICGEFHYSRYPCLYWEEELLKLKACGVNMVSTYVFWNHHEEVEGEFVWDGDRNVRYFIELCRKHDMWVMLRIGPFAHGEVRNGGFPDWMYGRPFTVRTNDEGYLCYVKRFFNEIGSQVEGLLFKDNGPIIGIQLENEHMHASPPWEFMVVKEFEWVGIGRDGADHIRRLKTLAQEAGLEAPIYTCTGWGGASFIEDETLPLYGGYAFQPWQLVYSKDNQKEHLPTNEYLIQSFHDRNFSCVEFKPAYDPEKYPYACCELGGGMACWYVYRFAVEPESVEAATLARIAGGCNFIGYYMFHDGSNPIGKLGYLNERVVPKISYNFQAPIGEYGQLRTSYKYLKPIFMFLEQFGSILCEMGTTVSEGMEALCPTDTETLRYAVRSGEKGGFVFLINYQDHVHMKSQEDISLVLRLAADGTGIESDELKFAGEDVQSVGGDLHSQQNELRIPTQGGITLDRNVSAILPFNLELDGLIIKYATAQLITGIVGGRDGDRDSERTYFFFAHDKMKCEYCLDASSVISIEVSRCNLRQEDGQIYVQVTPGMDCTFRVLTASGEWVMVCTLKRSQAMNLWKYELWGRERIFLSEACLLKKDDLLEIVGTDSSAFDISVYPAVEGGIAMTNAAEGAADSRQAISDAFIDKCSSDTNDSNAVINTKDIYAMHALLPSRKDGLSKKEAPSRKEVPSRKDGLFTTWHIELEQKKIELDVRKVEAGKAILDIPSDVLNGLNEVYLHIDYFGSVGNAFIDGVLTSDNFCNGAVWEIGIKRYMPRLAEKGMYFHIIPYSIESGVLFDPDIQFRHKPAEGVGAEIYSIRAVPEYKVVVYKI